MADRSNRVGQQLGNYRLTDLLGQGGFAEVYLGEHIHLGTKAAVKVLHTQLTSDNVEAFRTEARTIAHLIHPHIVRVLEFDVEENTPFLIMDYAPNGTLRKLHPKGSSLAITTIVTYVKQIADALQYAHDEKLIHRDIKPENMLVGRRNEILLSDFGIALVAQSSRYQSTQDVIGTVVYMSPEQIQGKPRPASDQYSLGIVVYEWLCGERPFHGSFTELCAQHMFASPPPLREKVPSIPPDIEQVVLTALAKDPKQRFATVQAFATALEQASQSGRSQPLVLPTLVIPSGQLEQNQPSVPLPVVASPHQPLPPTIPAPPPNPSPEPTTQVPPQNHPTHAPEGLDTPLPISRPTGHSSRRAVIAGLVGLTLVGGGIPIWFATSQRFTPKPPHRMIPTPTPLPIGTTLFTYNRHSSYVMAVAWSPDGKRIASGSLDRTVQVWDTVNGKNVSTYQGHQYLVDAVTWSPDSKRIASASDDNTVQVWDAMDGGNAFTYRGHQGEVMAVAWSPDGKRIASGSADWTVQVWDAVDGGHVFTYQGHSNYVHAVTWSLDGKRIASGSTDGTVQVWDAADGGHVYIYQGHSSQVSAVAWSPDGKRIASSGDDKTVQVWDAVDGGNAFTYRGHSNWVRAVAWSPDGKRIASGSADDTIQVWDAIDGSHVFTYHHEVVALAWSPDGKCITSGGNDRTVQVWVAS